MSAGRVVFVSRNGGMLVVEHADGYTVVEMLGDEGTIEAGDQVYGDWTALSGEPIRRNGEVFDAFFRGCWADPRQAIRNAGGA